MTRHVLPQRRPQDTFDLTHGNSRYAVSLGYYRDGSLGEVFVNSCKPGSDAEAVARDSAILVSFMIQHGLPVEEVRLGLTRDRQGSPASIVGAVLDAMAVPR